MRFLHSNIVTAGDMSGNIASTGVYLDQIALVSIQAVWTGTPAGNFKLQISNDLVQVANSANPGANVVNWTDYSGSTQAAGGAPGTFIWNLADAGYAWVRLVYTKSSSVGTATVTISGKG